jgi:hypothetical protein
MRGARRAVGIAALSACLLVVPARSEARLVVTVQVAYGAVAVGGLSLFIWVGGGVEGLRPGPLSAALLELRPGGARWGIPAPALRLAPGAEGVARPAGFQLELLRVRF